MDRKEIFRIKILSVRETFKNYPYLLSLALVALLITGGFFGLVWVVDEQLHIISIKVTVFSFQIASYDRSQMADLYELVLKVLAVYSVFKIFIGNVILNGIKNACVSLDKNYNIFSGFKSNYLKMVGTLFIKEAIIKIGYTLFLIPGLIMNYEYYFVDYLLIEKPELSIKEIFAESKRYTANSKYALLRFDFSYFYLYTIAYFLNQVSFGLSESFVHPIVNNARAKVYLAFKELYH